MIYYIDEEYIRNRSKIRFLKMHGYDVTHISNADEAWRVIYPVSSDDIDLIIVDVMLAAGNRYDRKQTKDFLITGITLIKDLLDQRKDIDPKKILLFSAATRDDIIKFIHELANDKKVHYKSKSDFNTLFDFLNYINSICKPISTESSDIY